MIQASSVQIKIKKILIEVLETRVRCGVSFTTENLVLVLRREKHFPLDTPFIDILEDIANIWSWRIL